MHPIPRTAAVLALASSTLVACGPPEVSELAPVLHARASDACAGGAVGYVILPLSNGRKAAVWYPTSSPEVPFQYPAGLTSHLAPGGGIAACQPLPLLVFSHGLGGDGIQSVFITEALARVGYVVIAPDHGDATVGVDGQSLTPPANPFAANLLTPQSWNQLSYVDRDWDVELALNTLLSYNASIGGSWIDPSRIGAFGHSLGGYTVLGAAGAWSGWKDSRIKAVAGLSPLVQPFLDQFTLGGVNVPVMYQGAQGDLFVTPSLLPPFGAYSFSNNPKYLAELWGGTHFEWTNAVCGSAATVDQCLSQSGNALVIDAYLRAFFDESLLGVDDGLLGGSGMGLFYYAHSP